MFAKRLFSSIVLWAVLLGVIFYLDVLAATLLCCLVSTIALKEFYDMLEKAGMKCSKYWGLTGGLILSAGTWWFSYRKPENVHAFEVLIIIALTIGLFIKELLDKNNTQIIHTVANTVLGVIYIPWLFAFFPKIKYFYQGIGSGPALFVFLLIVVTKFCDIGAYLTGRFFGRHKMIPRISPNKTWEGFFGGMVVALIASVTAFKYIEPRVKDLGFGYEDALALGVLLGLMGVLGDLVESLIKRETHVKDSGEVLPGIGGALDLIDSLLFTAPVLYAYLLVFVPAKG